MWLYEKRLQFPVNIRNKNARLAKAITSQLGGPDGELAASMRYFAQRYASILQKEPNLLAGVLSDKYVSGYTERHVRWSYNKVFLRFIQTIQKYEEAVSVLRVCQTKSGVTHN